MLLAFSKIFPRIQRKQILYKGMILIIIITLVYPLNANVANDFEHDAVYLKNGKKISGQIQQISADKLEITDKLHQKHVFSLAEIERIQYKNTINIQLKDKEKNKTAYWPLEPDSYIHNGFFFQLQSGFISTHAKISNNEQTHQLQSNGQNHYILIGGAIDWNLILFLSLGFLDHRNQTLPSALSAYTWENSASMGFGLYHYLMPSNFFWGLSLQTQQIVLNHKINQTTDFAKSSYEWRAHLGKEWWISKNLGLGFTLFSGLQIQGSSLGYVYGLNATITYN